MKTICLLTVLALGIAAVARAQSTVAPCSSSADTVGFNQLLRDIENSGLIQALPANLRVLPFEIVTAAENTELSKMFDELGYETILKVLDGLTDQFSHEFTKYLVSHLDSEGCAKTSTGK
ncbi:uncharacterized protein LOC112572796 [Pomacea canaliculata]|uniref:uncharacterized protein LOC112572796 n=1 Tax=Pomacea canaliculata TaxID=400727 RepID=UPI000D727223|nr:uncharacterized protein LOC112572796 [Pomacea canaliculata]XP_025108470.1 uncharacterized protein LOC112572796 [Pomacea canaliculata]